MKIRVPTTPLWPSQIAEAELAHKLAFQRELSVDMDVFWSYSERVFGACRTPPSASWMDGGA